MTPIRDDGPAARPTRELPSLVSSIPRSPERASPAWCWLATIPPSTRRVVQAASRCGGRRGGSAMSCAVCALIPRERHSTSVHQRSTQQFPTRSRKRAKPKPCCRARHCVQQLQMLLVWHVLDRSSRTRQDHVACLPDVIPGPKCESGYFRSLSRRFGHGTEGEVDGGDHRLLA